MKISFDFDSTLAENRIQKLAKKFISDGHDVQITTSRMSNFTGRPEWNKDLYKVANELGIKNIVFTDGADKWKSLKGVDIHFDDDQIEIEEIENNLPECIGVIIFDPETYL